MCQLIEVLARQSTRAGTITLTELPALSWNIFIYLFIYLFIPSFINLFTFSFIYVFSCIIFTLFYSIFRRWLYSHASIAVAFSDLIIMNMLHVIAGTQGPKRESLQRLILSFL